MTRVLTVYDSASGPVVHPADVDGFLAYAGGNDLHTWTRTQINQAAASAALCYPTWEYGKGRSGEADGLAFYAWLVANNVPADTLALLAMEAAVDEPYVDAFSANIGAQSLALYGSIDTLFNNPGTNGGWWPANPTGAPHLFAHEDVVGTQYAWTSLGQTGGYNLDLSLVEARARAWRPLDSIYRTIITTGEQSMCVLAHSLGLRASEILRITARCSPPAGFSPNLASYIDGCNLDAPMPAGLQLWVPA